MQDIIFEKSEKINDLVDKFISLPVETQRLLFNYAYYSRERRGWFDALNMLDLEECDNHFFCHFRTVFEIANYETRCSRYGIKSNVEVTINGETNKYDFAIWDIQTYENYLKAPKVILVNTGFFINTILLNYQADVNNILKECELFSAGDFWNDPYQVMLKIFDYADEYLGVWS